MQQACEICGCPKGAEWLTVADAASALGTVPQAVEALCDSGELKAEWQGRSWVVSHADLDRLLTEYEEPSG